MPALADQLLRETGRTADGSLASADGSVVLLRHRFAASEGLMGHPDQLRLGLVLGGGGLLQQRTAAAHLQAHWHPGQFNLVLPGDSGHYASPAVDLLGIAIDTRRFAPAAHGAQALQPLATRLHQDPVIAAVLQALWHTAQADACLPGFLEQGAQALLHRLAQLAGQAPPVATVRAQAPLSPRRLQLLQAFIDEHRAQPLDVAQLVHALQMAPSRFSRALQAATGLTPYAYLARQRMQWAADALLAGHGVTEVALATGYANPSKFSAAFRRVMGCVPSAWALRRHAAL
ncbi:MAG: Exoenzyme S synthesis regulatory protein ExsA [Stenotrophomonas maltophilia]|uniref:Exoenzyme S synthesis regulatory protein ExsA n=1 Tax=Stenotrophomonas maltophilia TaxID=40324 RepID=A0A7V8FIX3_STEMA|nr:MAG: Exoenzyme S synthesis regulatory protein ExsA [Stenotrophomonas maltophilia]